MQQLTGLVLCGGKSSRLGTDKSVINYHGMAQWRYLTGMLAEVCDEVLVSCTVSQATNFSKELSSSVKASFCTDVERFYGRGPMSGVLSAMEMRPATTLLVVGCDYPLLQAVELLTLLEARTEIAEAVCYHLRSESLDLPFPALYTPSIRATLLGLFEEGDYSLRSGLKKSRTIRLDPPNSDRLISANTPEEVARIQDRLARG